MPLTPFHLGPGLLFGLLLLRYADFPTFLVASVVVDWRAALVFLDLWPGPRHAWMHSYVGGLAFSLLLVGAMCHLRPRLDASLRWLRIRQEITTRKIAAGASLGIVVHVTIDAFHHPRMEPFLPLDAAPLYGLFSTVEMRLFTAFCFVLGLQLYLAHVFGVIDVGPSRDPRN